MERSAAAPTTPSEFVRWEEVYVSSSSHGKRQVHYFVKRRDGTADLAVLGKEKSLGRMSYRYSSACRSLLQMSPSAHLSKLRSRSEVVNWLNSVVLGSSPRGTIDTVGKTSLDRRTSCSLDGKTPKDVRSSKLGQRAPNFLWVGSPWTCRKKRRHYEAYQRNGVRISVHDFVYVLAEEEKSLVAYLEDLYEDSKGNKMVVVRWFHKIDEVAISLPRNYNDREVFFSLCLQDLSIECINGLATVLSPQHYEKYLKDPKDTLLQPFVCCSQFDNDEIKPFDVSQVKDYWRQDFFRNVCPSSASRENLKPQPSGSSPNAERNFSEEDPVRPKKRLRRLKERNLCLPPANKKAPSSPCVKVFDLTIGSQVEMLSQDSGIRGCWFRVSIIKKHKDKIKVKYEDLKSGVDETKNLEEWVPASRVANQDPAGLRLCGRKTIRPVPVPSKDSTTSTVKVGDIVDARWHDGWWEGIVIQIETEEKIRVYFPGEKQESVFVRCDVRHSQEWLRSRWEHIKARPDVAALLRRDLELDIGEILAVESTKFASGKLVDVVPRDDFSVKDAFCKKSKIVRDLAKDALLAQLKWRTLGKRRRSSISNNVGDRTNRSPEAVDTSKLRRLLAPTVVEHDNNCKYVGDSPFSSSVVPPLTNLVMSM